MRCPQCGAETPDREWNCVSCRVNVYWASQHYRDLAIIREEQGLDTRASTPSFLIEAHKNATAERAERGGQEEHRVRSIARLMMRRRGLSFGERDLARRAWKRPGMPRSGSGTQVE
jgi:hypothetical protein